MSALPISSMPVRSRSSAPTSTDAATSAQSTSLSQRLVISSKGAGRTADAPRSAHAAAATPHLPESALGGLTQVLAAPPQSLQCPSVLQTPVSLTPHSFWHVPLGAH